MSAEFVIKYFPLKIETIQLEQYQVHYSFFRKNVKHDRLTYIVLAFIQLLTLIIIKNNDNI